MSVVDKKRHAASTAVRISRVDIGATAIQATNMLEKTHSAKVFVFE